MRVIGGRWFIAQISRTFPADFICSVAQAILLRSQNMPAAYREQLTATIRAEIARLIEEGYLLDNPELRGAESDMRDRGRAIQKDGDPI
jgi:hypothetical protein